MAFGGDGNILFKVKADVGSAVSEIKKLTSTVESETGKVAGNSSKFAALSTSIDGSSTSMGGLGKAAGIAGIAVGAIGGIATTVAVGLFKMAEAASDLGSKIHDAAQQTGLTTETVSALRVAAEQGGSSLEAITKSAAKFTGSLVDAANGNKKLSEALSRFGIDAKTAFQDPDAALSKFITQFNKLPDSAQKSRDEMTIFRDRTGELIPVIKQVDGDFGAFMDRLRAGGLLMSQDSANAADAFGDKLTELKLQAEGVATTFALQFMPELTNSMTSVGQAFAINQDTVKEWGQNVAAVVRGLTAIVTSEVGQMVIFLLEVVSKLAWIYQLVKWIGSEDVPMTPNSSDPSKIANNPRHLQELRAAAGAHPRTTSAMGVVPGTGGKNGGADDAAQKALAAQREANKQAQQLREKETESVRAHLAEMRREYSLGLIDLEVYFSDQRAQARKDLAATIAELDAKQQALNANTKLADAARANEQAQIDAERTKANAKNFEAQLAIGDQQREAELAKLREQTAREEAIWQEHDARMLARIRDAEQQKLITHEMAAEQEAAIDQAARNRQMIALQAELLKAEGNKNEKARIQHEIGLLYERDATAKEESVRRIIEARDKDMDDLIAWLDEYNRRMQEQKDREQAIVAAYEAESSDSNSPAGGFLAQLVRVDPTKYTDPWKLAFADLKAMGVGAFKSLAEGMGQMIQNWILMGSIGPNAARKMVAGVLAALAVEAAVKAIMALADGIIALTNPFTAWKAPLYFHAAALYGAVAVGAAVVGRAVAGNSFRQQESAAGQVSGGSSSGNSGGSTGNRGPGYYSRYGDEVNTLSENRWNQLSPQNHSIAIRLVDQDERVLRTVYYDLVDGNGRLRTAVQDEIKRSGGG